MFIQVAQDFISKRSVATSAAGVALGVGVGSAESSLEKKNHMSTGARIGIAIATVVGLLIIGFGVKFLCDYYVKRLERKANRDLENNQQPPAVPQQSPSIEKPGYDYQSSYAESNEKLDSSSSIDYKNSNHAPPPPAYAGYQRPAVHVP